MRNEVNASNQHFFLSLELLSKAFFLNSRSSSRSGLWGTGLTHLCDSKQVIIKSTDFSIYQLKDRTVLYSLTKNQILDWTKLKA